MARVKSIPKRRKVVSSGAAVVTAAALNTRIHRILNAGQELKRFSQDASIAFPAAGTNLLAYCNPFAGIVQGAALNQRVGDSITVEKIVVTIRWFPIYGGAVYAGDLSCDYRSSMIKVPDTTLASTTLSALSLTNYTFSGFVSTGMLNNHDNKVIADKKKSYLPTPMSAGFGAPAGGLGYKTSVMEHHKKFSTGHKITYKTGGNLQNQDNFILVLAADLPGYLTGASQGSFYYAYNVFFRDG